VLSSGNLAASGDTLATFVGNCPPAGMVTIGTGTGLSVCGDNKLVLGTLAAGTYTLMLTDANYIPQAVNPGPPGASHISDGFTDLTGGVFQTCNTTSNGTTCITLSSNFAVDLVAPSAVLMVVPEPETLPLLLGALLAFVIWRGRAQGLVSSRAVDLTEEACNTTNRNLGLRTRRVYPMRRIRTYLLVTLGFGLAGAIGGAFASGTAQAIVATLVQIVNTAANPVLTQHVVADNPATQAVSLLCLVSVPANGTDGSCNLVNGALSNPPYVVPSGKRLVADSISGDLRLLTGQRAVVTYNFSDTQQNYSFSPPLTLDATGIPAGRDNYVWGLSVKFYADSGTSISVGALTTQGPFDGALFAFGHLENIQ
jgi:hypothetical protein